METNFLCPNTIKYQKKCPICSDEMIYSGPDAKYNLSCSIKKNLKCIKCRQKHRLITVPNGGWKKECPKCKKEIIYSTKWGLNSSIKRNVICKKCSSEINVGCFKKDVPSSFAGKHHTKKTIEKLKKLKLGHKHTKETRKKMSSSKLQMSDETKKRMSLGIKIAWKDPKHRKKWIDSLVKTKFIGRRCDMGQLEFLDKWNSLGFNFQPNYMICGDDYLYYLDGYDSVHNVILEYDTKYHNISYQQKKDLIRQQKIIDILKPKKFWRYDLVSKTCKNVVKTDGVIKC